MAGARRPITFASAVASPVPYVAFAIAGPSVGIASAISTKGPLGKPSVDDDQLEAARRKNAMLFCLAVLTLLNMVSAPLLMMAAAQEGWAMQRILGVAFALLFGNLTCFASLPTLYASWMSPKR